MRILCLLFIATSAVAFAEDRPPLATDRPGFSDGSHLVAPGTLQLETGFFRTQVGSDVTTSWGDGLLRYGLSATLELRVIGIAFAAAPGVEQWLEPSVGFKTRLVQTRRAEVTLIGQTTTPIGAGALRSNAWNPTVKLAATTPVGKDTLGGNLVFARFGSGPSRFDQSALSVFFSRPVSGSTGLTGEVWAVDRISRGGPSAGFVSVAVTHLLDSDRQLDLRVGTGFDQARDGWFLQGGFSVRF